MWVKQKYKPSPSHRHFYRWYGYHSQLIMGGLWHCFANMMYQYPIIIILIIMIMIIIIQL